MATSLGKFRHEFQAATLPGGIMVTGCADVPAANGIYAYDSSAGKFTRSGCEVSSDGSSWVLASSGSSLDSSSDCPASPVGAAWGTVSVLEGAVMTVPASTSYIVLSTIFTGGPEGGFAATVEGSLAQELSLAPSATVILDTKQVFTPGDVWFCGQAGLGVQVSYAVNS